MMPEYGLTKERFPFTVDSPVAPFIHRECGKESLQRLEDGRWVCFECGMTGHLVLAQ